MEVKPDAICVNFTVPSWHITTKKIVFFRDYRAMHSVDIQIYAYVWSVIYLVIQ